MLIVSFFVSFQKKSRTSLTIRSFFHTQTTTIKRSSIAKITAIIIVTGSFPDLLLLGCVSEKFKIDYDDIVLLKKLYSFNLYNWNNFNYVHLLNISEYHNLLFLLSFLRSPCLQRQLQLF